MFVGLMFERTSIQLVNMQLSFGACARKSMWVVASCLLLATLLLSSCGKRLTCIHSLMFTLMIRCYNDDCSASIVMTQIVWN